MSKVYKITKLQSKSLTRLLEVITKDLGMDLQLGDQTSDQILLYNRDVHVSLEERIQVRMMCSGDVIYTFEFLDRKL